MQLEAEKPAHRSLAPRRDPGKHLVPLDAPIIAHPDGRGIHEANAGAVSQASEQIATQQRQRARHELHEPSVADQVRKFGAQVNEYMLGVVGFESAILALMKVDEDRHDFTRV